MTADHTLQVQDLSLGYGERTVIEGLDLDLLPGKVTAIVGANASGKSTLLRSMSRLLTPRRGQVLLDEPTTFLDVAHQVEVLDLLTDLNRERGITLVMVLHDLNLAARYSDRLVMIAGGAVAASGPAAEVLTEQRVREVFGLESRIIADPVSGTPLMLPIGRHHVASGGSST